jgi:hypothetical protein
MFRILWYGTWLLLLLAVGRAAFASREIVAQLGAGTVTPQALSTWQLMLLPFCVFAVFQLIFSLRLRISKTGRPSKEQWGRLIGMAVMVFWLLLFSARA